MPDALVGRQPIFDRAMKVHAYELLYRSDEENRAKFSDGNFATSSVVLNTFLEIGLERVVGDHPAFVNFTREFVLGEYPIPAKPDRIVIELLEDVAPDDEVVRALRGFADAGFRIALDDFTWSEAYKPLFPIVSMVKLDVMALGREGIRETIDRLRPYRLKLVAEKVDNAEDLDFCQKLGFHYFQGYFLTKPQIIRGQRMPTNRVALLNLLGKLYDPKVHIRDVEDLVSQDVALSYRLVRAVNSALYAPRYPIDSIRQAIFVLGLNQLTSWVSIMSLSGLNDKPSELLLTALVRARMCENLARARNLPSPESYFTVGLFSLLDALLDRPMVEVLEALPLAEELTAAILRQEGEAGAILACVLAQEQGEPHRVHELGFELPVVNDCWLQAVDWAREACSVVVMTSRQAS